MAMYIVGLYVCFFSILHSNFVQTLAGMWRRYGMTDQVLVLLLENSREILFDKNDLDIIFMVEG